MVGREARRGTEALRLLLGERARKGSFRMQEGSLRHAPSLTVYWRQWATSTTRYVSQSRRARLPGIGEGHYWEISRAPLLVFVLSAHALPLRWHGMAFVRVARGDAQ